MTVGELDIPCQELAVNVLDEKETPIAYYHIDREQAESFNEGLAEDYEYVGDVMDTYEWAYEEYRWD